MTQNSTFLSAKDSAPPPLYGMELNGGAVGLKKGDMGGVGVGSRAVGLKIGDKGGGGSEERWKQKSCHGIMGGPALTPPWVSPLLLQTPADLFKVIISLSS